MGFGLTFIFLTDRYELERHTVKIRVMFGIRMVADNERKVASQFATSLAVKQIDEAVIVLGHENGDSWTMTAKGKLQFMPNLCATGANSSSNCAKSSLNPLRSHSTRA